jgi:uncharacterized membrane protein (DUF4010 family)
VLLFALRLLRLSAKSGDHVLESFSGRAFQPLQAIVFSVTVTSLIWASAWLKHEFGTLGATWAIAAGGLADAHSAVVSAGSLVHAGELDVDSGALAILAALASNVAMKIAVAAATGGARFARELAPPLLLGVLAAACVLLSPSWLMARP